MVLIALSFLEMHNHRKYVEVLARWAEPPTGPLIAYGLIYMLTDSYATNVGFEFFYLLTFS